MPVESEFKIAVLISGGGTTLKNLIDVKQQGCLPVDIRLAISSNPAAKGIKHANDNGVDVTVVDRRNYDSDLAFSELIFQHCRDAGVDLVVMGGFLKKVVIPADFENRVINIHPSLIPDYCGKGMYGMHVHRAVIAAGETTSGCTVHFVDNEYDHGPIIAQEKVPVLDTDSPEQLQQRIFEAECQLYPAVISSLAAGSSSSVRH